MQIFNVSIKYQIASVKALVQVDFPVHAHKSTNKALIKKQSVKKKWLSSKRCHFVKMYFNGIKLLHANVQCVYTVYTKYQNVSVIPRICTIYGPLKITKDNGTWQ